MNLRTRFVRIYYLRDIIEEFSGFYRFSALFSVSLLQQTLIHVPDLWNLNNLFSTNVTLPRNVFRLLQISYNIREILLLYLFSN